MPALSAKYVFQLNFPGTWSQALWAHDEIQQIVVPLEGRLQATIGESCVTAELGNVLLFPRAVPYEERALDGRALILLYVGWEGPDADLLGLPAMSVDKQGRIATLVRWIRELFPAENSEDEVVIEGLLRAILREYRHGATATIDERILRVRRYVQERLAEPLSVGDLARNAGLSPSSFSRMFKSATGQSPMEFVRQERIVATKTLLKSTQLKLAQVATLVGFRNEYELSRAFHRETGQAPSAFRGRGRRPA